MEDILDLYAEADDRYYPVVCFDECPIQLVSEVRQPIAAEPGSAVATTITTVVKALPTSSSPSVLLKAGGISL